MRGLDASRAPRLVLLGLVFLLLPAATLAMVAARRDGSAPREVTLRSQGQELSPDRGVDTDETFVRTRVLPSGDLQVTHWIDSTRLLLTVDLSVPGVTGAEGVSAHHVRVVADGRPVTGPDRITDAPGRFSLLGAHSVEVRYRLTGAVERSPSVPGRGLALVTSLDVQQEPAPVRVIRSILAPEVLSLACAPTTSQPAPQPCGAVDPGGGWTVELTGDRADDRVLAQVTLE